MAILLCQHLGGGLNPDGYPNLAEGAFWMKMDSQTDILLSRPVGKRD